ncbi:lyase [Seminavis robusta]|uniref:DNA-(apurinic or apyrimidinic site) endonuclease n=1 Tax=Seminavis robusta TaxID=568900 RepID=A0A9N8H6W1_9STRA|nr:lyase [Seminavis robusta]|eukprot:Sro123_g059660.1 lyase (464) ;mRNA; f:82832-84223
MPRQSRRLLATQSNNDTEDNDVQKDDDEPEVPKVKKRIKGTTAKTKQVTPKKRKTTANDNDDSDTEFTVSDSSTTASSSKASPKKKSAAKTKTKKVTKRKGTTTKKTATQKTATTGAMTAEDGSDTGSDVETKSQSTTNTKKKKTTRKKKAPIQSITERDELPKLCNPNDNQHSNSYLLKIATWNVAGLRAVLRKDPDALATLVAQHNIDILCLQETKVQEMHLDDPKLKLRGHLLEAEGYDAYYSCSTARKGYAGTAVFVKRACGLVPDKVSYGLGMEKHDAEGRVIVLDFAGFSLVNLYVPNSGQKLDRLQYRTEEWDKDLLAFLQHKQKDGPVMWLGDLNVAHLPFDAYNFGAKHLDKQAGLTPQERASFQAQLDAGFVDAFRHLHPNAKGHYTYWSQRAGNREPNRGLRLDYFVCDPTFFRDDDDTAATRVIARDSYMIPEQMGSDHCPAVLELEIIKP